MNTLSSPTSKPWYREPWPWFLISLPAAAVIAGLTTVWIAANSADGLVVGSRASDVVVDFPFSIYGDNYHIDT